MKTVDTSNNVAQELLNFDIIEEFDNGESGFLAKKYYLMSKLAQWVLS